MRLRVLGSNGTYPTPGHPASGYLVDDGGTSIMLDAGPGTFPALQTLMDPAELDAIVISHVHGDHCLDIFPLFNALRYGPSPASGLPVVAPAGVAERIAGFTGADDDHDLFRVFDFREVAAGEEVVVGSLRLGFGAAVHPVPALLTAVIGGGRRLVYSGDTGPGGDLEELASGADLLLCEATYQGRPGPDRYPYHLFAVESAAVAAAAGVPRLLVTHVFPGLDPDVSIDEARAVFDGEIGWAAPGLEVMV